MHHNSSCYQIFGFIFSLTALFLVPTSVESTQPVDPEAAKQYIAEILSEPDFKTTREEYQWRYLGECTPKEEQEPQSTAVSFSFIGVIAQLFELLLWVLLGAGIIVLVIYGSRWLEQWRPRKANRSDYVATPRLLNQEIINGQILPTDISQQAWTLWQSGQPVAAISLLYRGALSVLIAREGLTINDSATENECLRLVKYKQPVELTGYFSGLTRAWQNLAYANRLPSETDAQRLCHEWPQYFGSEPGER